MGTNEMKCLWTPSEAFIADTNIKAYTDWLSEKKGLSFDDYNDLWQWSVDELEDFWASLWEYFDITSHAPYKQVLSSHKMPGAKWFEGSTLNYAEHVFKSYSDDYPAIIFKSEVQGITEVSWADLKSQVAKIATYLKSIGVEPGDRVVSYMPNIPQTIIAFLAVSSIGAVWSSCSPDFGTNSVVDRFKQISPKVMFAVDGYHYGGKSFDRTSEVVRMESEMESLEKIIFFPYANPEAKPDGIKNTIFWQDAVNNDSSEIDFVAVPFDHPIWTLYSSGTTGIPKAITHGHGGALIEHLKYNTLHANIKPGDRFFWFSTTGWVMWNLVMSTTLAGATAVIYDGNPGYPDLGTNWQFAEDAKITTFGTSAAFLISCMKEKFKLDKYNLETLKCLGSTGSPLPPEGFDWVYENVKKDLWLTSVSGGTDIASGFVGGLPTLPVYSGEIQCRLLGSEVQAFDINGNAVINEVGEMVITKPMPSMPIYLWNDKDGKRYQESYFDVYPGYWRHGDWLQISDIGSAQILGRSDSTLNRSGIRIGTSEVYRAVDKVEAVADSLIVSLELPGGEYYMPLFVTLKNNGELTDEIIHELRTTIRSAFSPRHVPDEIIKIDEIPYTISGKKLETPVKKILLGAPLDKAVSRDAMQNGDSIDFFVNFAKQIKERYL